MHWWDSAAWDGTTPWLMFLPMLWPIVMIGCIVVLVMLLMRCGTTETPLAWRRDPMRPTPLEILSERFARGEIDRQECEERKGFLSRP